MAAFVFGSHTTQNIENHFISVNIASKMKNGKVEKIVNHQNSREMLYNKLKAFKRGSTLLSSFESKDYRDEMILVFRTIYD